MYRSIYCVKVTLCKGGTLLGWVLDTYCFLFYGIALAKANLRFKNAFVRLPLVLWRDDMVFPMYLPRVVYGVDPPFPLLILLSRSKNDHKNYPIATGTKHSATLGLWTPTCCGLLSYARSLDKQTLKRIGYLRVLFIYYWT